MRNSKVIICAGINMDKDYLNVINYSNSQMQELINRKSIAAASNLSFIREENAIKVEIPYGSLITANYMAFQNPDYNNKWFYAWVDDIRYVSDKTSLINYTIDEWSTWFRDLTLNACMVEREHVNDDTIGVNRQPESLPIGSYRVVNKVDYTIHDGNSTHIGILASDWPVSSASDPKYDFGKVYNGTYSGMLLLHYHADSNNSGQLAATINQVLRDFDNIDRGNAVQTIFNYPSWLEGAFSPSNYRKEDILTLSIQPESGYTPKNNKLYTYPYTKCVITNNDGAYSDTAFEDYTNGIASIKIIGTLFPTPEVVAIPIAYQKRDYRPDMTIKMSDMPTCAWTSDYFANWWAFNQNSLIYNALTGVLGHTVGGVGELAQKSPVGAISEGLSMVDTTLRVLNNVDQQMMIPNQARGNRTVGVANLTTPDKYKYTMTQETLQRDILESIDDFFSMFGYAINKLKVPNISGRANWNYIKIIGDIGSGAIPSRAMETINRIARKGVTIWHSHDVMGDYSLDNSIV